MIQVDPTALAKIDELLKTAEKNGWNSAINACRQILPVEYSMRIRSLYRDAPPLPNGE